MRIGVYVCHCGRNIAEKIDCPALAEYALNLESVAVSRDLEYACSKSGQEAIEKDIEKQGVERVVVAACSPRMHEDTFRKLLMRKGLNEGFLEIANIREQCSWVHEGEVNDRKAKALLRSAVFRVGKRSEITSREFPVAKAALVVGGGIAGLSASLSLAAAGINTFLVERSPTLGGHMAKLDRTFPTLDCSACILTPVISQVAASERIQVLTMSEVVGFSGFKGSFRARVRQRSRFVDSDACDGCGRCAEECVLRNKIPDEHNEGLSSRSAVYIPHPSAYPYSAVVDMNSCLLFKKGKCSAPCVDACSRGAIDFGMEDSEYDIEVGAVILATGFERFRAGVMPEYGYSRYREVVDALEFERLISSAGPTGGALVLPGGTVPRSIAFIHCVGSRDERTNEYCSRVCCMYLMKQALSAREKTGATVYEFYIDTSAFGKGYQEFYRRARDAGIHFVRGRVAEVVKRRGSLRVIAEDTLLGEVVDVPVDMVVLGVGLCPPKGTSELARTFGIQISPDGFLSEVHLKLHPVESHVDGVFLAGCCQGPKDITDTVSHARAAASAALEILSCDTVRSTGPVCSLNTALCSGCGICVLVCPYNALGLGEAGAAEVNELLCRGCGICLASCNCSALDLPDSSDEELLSGITGLLMAED